jgi:hypothetical protein
LNGNNILGEGSEEWIINFESLKSTMSTNGYSLLTSDLFENLFDNSFKFKKCENDISFLNRYCVFKKGSCSEIKTSLLNQKVVFAERTKLLGNALRGKITEPNFQSIELHQNNISVKKISSLYELVDVINCIEYKYYKNIIRDVQLDITAEEGIEIITNAFTQLNMTYKPVFINDPLNMLEYKHTKGNIYFTYYKHVIERKTDNDEETEIQYNNWYIIMHNDNLLFEMVEKETVQETTSRETIQQAETQQSTTQQSTTQQSTTQQSTTQQLVATEYNNFKQNGTKITIKILKDLLQKLNIKTTGKKEELEQRLSSILM